MHLTVVISDQTDYLLNVVIAAVRDNETDAVLLMRKQLCAVFLFISGAELLSLEPNIHTVERLCHLYRTKAILHVAGNCYFKVEKVLHNAEPNKTVKAVSSVLAVAFLCFFVLCSSKFCLTCSV